MEIDEGVAYSRALKQSAGPVAETAPARTRLQPGGDPHLTRYHCRLQRPLQGRRKTPQSPLQVRGQRRNVRGADTTSGPGPPSLPRDGDCLGGDVGREPVSTARTAGHHHPADCDHGSGNRFLPSRRRATERPTHNHKSQAALNVLAEFFESRQMLMREDFLRILRQSQTTEPRMKIQTSES